MVGNELMKKDKGLFKDRTASFLYSYIEALTPNVSVLEIGPQFNSVAQSCPTLCDPMNRSMPGLPVHHQLPEFTQTHVH